MTDFEINNIDVTALIELYKQDKKQEEEREYSLVIEAKDYDPKTHPKHVRCHDGKYRRIYIYTCYLMFDEYWICPNCGCENRIDFDRCGFPLGCSFGFDNEKAMPDSDRYDDEDYEDEYNHRNDLRDTHRRHRYDDDY